MSDTRPTALIFAYAAEPDRGSEPGAGWSLVETVAEVADCIVLGAPEHTAGVESWLIENPSAPIEYIEITEAPLSHLWKWHRIPWFLVYLNWLKRAEREARQLLRERPIDLAIHATYSTYWLPTPATELGIPSVWGPVGGGVSTCKELRGTYDLRGWLSERLDLVAVQLISRWPATRRTWRNATQPVVQNRETLERLRLGGVDAPILNHTLFHDQGRLITRETRSESPFLIFPSALESRKGAALAIRALAQTPDTRLKIVNTGPLQRRLERLSARLGVADRVEFLGRVPRAEYFKLLKPGARRSLYRPARRGRTGPCRGDERW